MSAHGLPVTIADRAAREGAQAPIVAELIDELERAARYVACNEQGRCRGCGRASGHLEICGAAPRLERWRRVIERAREAQKAGV